MRERVGMSVIRCRARSMLWCSCLTIAPAIALLASGLPNTSVAAQGIMPKPAGPNTLSGVVTDTLGNPVSDADVYITLLKRRVRTRDDGSFRFDKMRPGVYDVGARAFGYVARSYSVNVGDDGGSVYIRMIRLGSTLASMITTADRMGLSGVIGDTAFRAMSNVTVRVIGPELTTRTDSAGAFSLAVSPGHYLVELTRDGFARQVIGVTIPDNEGRKIAAWLVPQFGGVNPLEGANLFEMSQRVMRANPVWSRYYTREDLAKQGITEVRQVANRVAMRNVNPDCPVIIDGGPRTLPLWQLAAGDVEFVELYTARPTRNTVTSLSGLAQKITTSTSLVPTSECGVSLVAWLRH